MDLRSVVPQFNLYNRQWPIRTRRHDDPPAKFVHDAENRRGASINSIVCPGSIISGGVIKDSVIGRNVKIHSFAEVTDSIIFDNVEVGRGCRIHKSIVDKNNVLEEGIKLGFDPLQDARDFYVSPTGIVVVQKKPRMEAPIGTIRI
jgi:glucose-1-phosphate adenylyltransferase